MRTEKQLANLKPPFKKGEYSETQRKGTETFKKNAKEIKTMREILTNVGSEENSNGITIKEAIAKKLLSLALSGNLKAIEMYRDTIGEKPIDRQDVDLKINKAPKIIDDIK